MFSIRNRTVCFFKDKYTLSSLCRINPVLHKYALFLLPITLLQLNPCYKVLPGTAEGSKMQLQVAKKKVLKGAKICQMVAGGILAAPTKLH